MENIVTVDYLLNILQREHDGGHGDMRIKCQDGFLHEDEVIFKYAFNEIEFRGLLYNFPIAKRISEFYNDIDKAYRRFYK